MRKGIESINKLASLFDDFKKPNVLPRKFFNDIGYGGYAIIFMKLE